MNFETLKRLRYKMDYFFYSHRNIVNLNIFLYIYIFFLHIDNFDNIDFKQ